jgi:hypothetical protein
VYDDSGLPSTDPGKVIESFNFTNLSQEPKIYTGNSFLNPLLKGSTQYWVVLKTDNSATQIQWKWNNIGTTGLAYCNPPVGNPWIYYKGKTPAFDIKGSAAVPDTFEVYIDIKPGSCPNPLNVKSKGVLPLAVLGTAEFDVSNIDPATIQLSREGVEGEIFPLRWSYEDVGTPFEGELCGCHALNGDGIIDLSLKFDMQALVTTLKLGEVKGSTLPLTLTGNLKEEFGGTPIEGQDCIRVLK